MKKNNKKIGNKLFVSILTLFLLSSASAMIIDSVVYNGPQGKGIDGNTNITLSQAVFTKEIRFIGSIDGDDSSTFVIADDRLSFIISMQVNNGDWYEYWVILWNNATKENDILVECPLDNDLKTKDNIKLDIDTLDVGIRLNTQKWSFTIAEDNVAIIGLKVYVGKDVNPGFYEIPFKITVMEITSHIENSERPNTNHADYDNDGLPNWQELDYGQNAVEGNRIETNPLDDDHDDDGLKDSTEDANMNSIVDFDETDPLNPDTDGDGLNDGLERGLTEPEGTGTADTWQPDLDPDSKTDPFDTDTDNDGLTDDQEDRNKNGRVDFGETNPVDTDTDDDGLCDGWLDYIIPNGLRDPLEGEDFNLDTHVKGYLFDLGLTYKNQLIVRDISTLITAFETNGFALSGNAEISLINEEYLFSLEPDFSQYLVEGSASQEFRFVFDYNCYHISSNAQIFKLNGNKWKITDGNNIFILINTELKLNIYNEKKWEIRDGIHLNNFYRIKDTGTELEVYGMETDPTKWDTDGDSLPDGLERGTIIAQKVPGGISEGPNIELRVIYLGTDTGSSNYIPDADKGSTKTDPLDWDTDGDNLPDGWIDFNNNGVKDKEEFEDFNTDGKIEGDSGFWGILESDESWTETDPNSEDSDEDLIHDWDELHIGDWEQTTILFNLDLSFKQYLNEGPVLDIIRNAFKDNEYFISHNAQIIKINDGKWEIIDVYKIYGITDTGTLNIYEMPKYHKYETNPNEWDTDGDGLGDRNEMVTYNTDPTQIKDSDGDGLADESEINIYRTQPNDRDSDNDGFEDGEEINMGTNPNDTDSDNEGLADGEEVHVYMTDPSNPDTDNDGLTDYEEIFKYNTDPLDTDTDDDGLIDGDEVYIHFTDPFDDDTDDDRLLDGEEINIHFSNPLNNHTDNDGLDDWEEVNPGADGYITDAWNPDTDGDRLRDEKELEYGTNPSKIDTDDDGLDDFYEIVLETDPTDNDTDDDLVSDGDEVNVYNSNPKVNDTDGDGLNDYQESILYNTDPCLEDTDLDYLNDYQEVFEHPTNPIDKDTDDDGLIDGNDTKRYCFNLSSWYKQYIVAGYIKSPLLNAFNDRNYTISSNTVLTKVSNYTWKLRDGDKRFQIDIKTSYLEVYSGYKTDYMDPDTDDDGLLDGEEVYIYDTDPLLYDTDFDGMPDGWEIDNSLNPKLWDSYIDSDGDGLTNLEEYQHGTNPKNSDSDNDGLLDGEEVNTHFTDPADSDSDNDGIPDGWEVDNSLNPLINDSGLDKDGDGLTNFGEYQYDTDPNNHDTDNDGMLDGWEVDNSLNPKSDDSNGDPDGDSYTNLQEYLAGTDPQDKESHP